MQANPRVSRRAVDGFRLAARPEQPGEHPPCGSTPSRCATGRVAVGGLRGGMHTEVNVDCDRLVIGVVARQDWAIRLLESCLAGDNFGAAARVGLAIIAVTQPRAFPVLVKGFHVRHGYLGIVHQQHPATHVHTRPNGAIGNAVA